MVTIMSPMASAEGMNATEKWQIVHTAALALRLAIEQYVPAAQRDKAIEIVNRIIRSDAPSYVKFEESVIVADDALN